MYGLQRERDGSLSFTFYFENGISKVTVLEKENRLRIETRRNSLWEYFDNLHATAVNTPVRDGRIRLWTYYEEFANWSLLAMALSGICLWLMSRPEHRVALVLFLSGLHHVFGLVHHVEVAYVSLVSRCASVRCPLGIPVRSDVLR
jgi:hypothetical protein